MEQQHKNAISTASKLVRLLANKPNQQLIELLTKRREMVVTEIYETLKWEQSVASQHLGALRKIGIVNARRAGQFIHYSVNNKAYAAAIKWAQGADSLTYLKTKE